MSLAPEQMTSSSVVKWFIILFTVLASCEYAHRQPACQLDQVSFSRQVLPVITNRCATPLCHSPLNASSLLTISNFDQIIRDSSDIHAYIKTKKMPAGEPLTECEYNTLLRWFNQGPKNN